MIDLKSRIEESLFGGFDSEATGKSIAQMENIKKVCYKDNSNIFDGVTGWVRGGDSGIEIYAPMFPSGKLLQAVSKNKKWITRGAQEFVINSNATKLNLNISKFQGNLNIKCRNLQTLEGIFTPDCEFMGRLSIWYCPNLKSIKGLPKVIMKDLEIPGGQNGFLGLNNVSLEPTPEQIEYLPKEMNELSWNWTGDNPNLDYSPNLIKRMSIRSQILKHTKGLVAIDIQGHYKRV